MKWKSVVKRCIIEKSLKYLEDYKQNHSKVMRLKHNNLKIHKYFLPNKTKMSKEEIQMIFKMTCRSTDLKMNMQGIYAKHECEV